MPSLPKNSVHCIFRVLLGGFDAADRPRVAAPVELQQVLQRC